MKSPDPDRFRLRRAIPASRRTCILESVPAEVS